MSANSIGEAWAEYRDPHLEKASFRDLRVMKVAFHCGIAACLSILVREGQPLDEDLVDRLVREATAFADGAE